MKESEPVIIKKISLELSETQGNVFLNVKHSLKEGRIPPHS